MNVIHFLATGGVGGIESLVREYADKSALNNFYVIFWGGGANSEIMKARGHNVIDLCCSKKEVWKTYRKLKHYVEQYKIDSIVVHHAAPAMWFYMTLLKKKNPNLSTYIYAHGALRDMLRVEKKQWVLCKAVLKFAFKRCNNVIAISEAVRNSFSDFGFELDKIKVIYNGVDCAQFTPRITEVNDVIHLAYVGRLIKQKGVDRLLKAISCIKTDKPFKCDIVGDGVERENLEQLSKELKINDKVIFHGIRKDVPEFLPKENIFVHPAAWEEGFGIAVVEAMAAGLLPVAFNKGAIPEIIDDGEDGFIVYEETPEALAEKLEYIIENYNSIQILEMRKRAVSKAIKFDLQIFVDALDNEFRDGVSY